jgi:hypothetical protein
MISLFFREKRLEKGEQRESSLSSLRRTTHTRLGAEDGFQLVDVDGRDREGEQA